MTKKVFDAVVLIDIIDECQFSALVIYALPCSPIADSP